MADFSNDPNENIWGTPTILTDLSFVQVGGQWIPNSQTDRLSAYQQNRKLFESKHELVYKDWVRLLRDDQQATMRLIFNWHKRLSVLWADLLLGEPPKFSVPGKEIAVGDKDGDGDQDIDNPNQDALDRIREDNSLDLVSYEVAIDVSRFGTGVFKVRFVPGKTAIIEPVNPSLWFPVVHPDNVKDVIAHVIAWDFKVPKAGMPGMIAKIGIGAEYDVHMKCEIHEKGKITYREFLVKDGRLSSLLSEFEEETNIDDFLIVPVHNLVTTDRATGLDDYTDIDSIVQELEIRASQIARILDKHSDPSMYGPATALIKDKATGQMVIRGGGQFYPLEHGDSPPGYVVWDGQLEAAFKEFDTLMEQLYFLSETSPAAFGQLKSGLAESGSALRRLMMAALAKVNRIRMRFDPALKNVLFLASQLELQQRLKGAVDLTNESITIDWQDGLPRDEQEVTNVEVERYTAGLSSLESSVRRLYNLEGDALQDEVEHIKEEKAANSVVPPAQPMVVPPLHDKPDNKGQNFNQTPTNPLKGTDPLTPPVKPKGA
jgi:hypothetical protein